MVAEKLLTRSFRRQARAVKHKENCLTSVEAGLSKNSLGNGFVVGKAFKNERRGEYEFEARDECFQIVSELCLS